MIGIAIANKDEWKSILNKFNITEYNTYQFCFYF